MQTRRLSRAFLSTRIVSIDVNATKKCLTIEREDKKRYAVPFAYAWEHSNAKRTQKLRPSPAKVRLSDDSISLVVDWSTGERTKIDSDWLARQFAWCQSKAVSPFRNVTKKYWESDYGSRIRNFDFYRILHDDVTLVEFFKTLEEYGLVMISDATTESGQLLKLASRVGWLKPTIYGDLLTIESTKSPTNVAYTNKSLVLHSDLPYMAYSPEFQLLHCIDQLPGPRAGSGWFCDGFAVANYMRKEFPRDFDILRRMKIQFYYAEENNFDCVHWDSLIKLDGYGDIETVYLANYIRGDRFGRKLKDGGLWDWYEAYRRFVRLAHNSRFIVEIKLIPSQILVFDSLRVFHGRPEFELKGDSVRRLELVYVDRDALYAKARQKLLCT